MKKRCRFYAFVIVALIFVALNIDRDSECYAGSTSDLEEFNIAWEEGYITTTATPLSNPNSHGWSFVRSMNYVFLDGAKFIHFVLSEDMPEYQVYFFGEAKRGSYISRVAAKGKSGEIRVEVPEGANYFKIAIGKKGTVSIDNCKLPCVLGSKEKREAIDIVWENGYITTTATPLANPNSHGWSFVRSKNYIPLNQFDNLSLYMKKDEMEYQVYFFEEAKKSTCISRIAAKVDRGSVTINIPNNAKYFKIAIGVKGLIDFQEHKETKVYGESIEIEQLKPMITIIDDDGKALAANSWERIADQTGIDITMAIITNEVGNQEGGYMTWKDVERLSKKGFEFVSHTDNHVVLTNCDEQTILSELTNSIFTLDTHNCESRFLVYPQNANNEYVHSLVDDHFLGAFQGKNKVNTFPISRYEICRVNLINSNATPKKQLTLSAMKKWIDSAVQKKGWLVFMAHNYYNGVVGEKEEAELVEMIEYAKEKGCTFVTASEGYTYYLENGWIE